MQSKTKKNIRVAICFATILIATAIHGLPALADTEKPILFVEVMPNPDGTDTKENEYFKLKNNTDNPINLANWKVCNISNDCYTLKNEIAQQSCLKVFRVNFVFSLHNDKEELSLYDDGNNLINKISTGSAPSGKAWLCQEGSCEWGDAKNECDYSNLNNNSNSANLNNQNGNNNNERVKTTAGTEVETKNQQNTDTNATSNNNKNSNKNKNTNTNSDKKAKTNFEIASVKDWKKAEKEMNQKNLLSLAANIQGKILIPYNIAKANSFYILSSDKLVQISIYASRQEDFKDNLALYKENTQVKIQDGILKNNQGIWQLGVEKNTKLQIEKTRTETNSESISTRKINFSNIQKDQGKLVEVKGEISKKSGQYFYVINRLNNKQTLNVYIPSIVWAKYLAKQNIGIFPNLENGKIVRTNEYKGKTLEIKGIIETSGNTYRILVADENNISMASPKIQAETTVDSQTTDSKNKNENPNSSVPKTTEPKPKLTADNQNNNKPGENQTKDNSPSASQSNKVESLKTTLAQRLGWSAIWNIFAKKITLGIGELF